VPWGGEALRQANQASRTIQQEYRSCRGQQDPVPEAAGQSLQEHKLGTVNGFKSQQERRNAGRGSNSGPPLRSHPIAQDAIKSRPLWWAISDETFIDELDPPYQLLNGGQEHLDI